MSNTLDNRLEVIANAMGYEVIGLDNGVGVVKKPGCKRAVKWMPLDRWGDTMLIAGMFELTVSMNGICGHEARRKVIDDAFCAIKAKNT